MFGWIWRMAVYRKTTPIEIVKSWIWNSRKTFRRLCAESDATSGGDVYAKTNANISGWRRYAIQAVFAIHPATSRRTNGYYRWTSIFTLNTRNYICLRLLLAACRVASLRNLKSSQLRFTTLKKRINTEPKFKPGDESKIRTQAGKSFFT